MNCYPSANESPENTTSTDGLARFNASTAEGPDRLAIKSTAKTTRTNSINDGLGIHNAIHNGAKSIYTTWINEQLSRVHREQIVNDNLINDGPSFDNERRM